MLEILLSQAGFKMIKQMEFCKSSVAELEEPLHVEGFEREWQNLNKKFYANNGLIHKYQDGKYHINFSLTGFDRDPYSSLIVEAVKLGKLRNRSDSHQKLRFLAKGRGCTFLHP